MIACLRDACRDFWTAFWWETTDCGCAYSMGRRPRVRTCSVHVHAQERIAEQLAGGRR